VNFNTKTCTSYHQVTSIETVCVYQKTGMRNQ